MEWKSITAALKQRERESLGWWRACWGHGTDAWKTVEVPQRGPQWPTMVLSPSELGTRSFAESEFEEIRILNSLLSSAP